MPNKRKYKIKQSVTYFASDYVRVTRSSLTKTAIILEWISVPSLSLSLSFAWSVVKFAVILTAPSLCLMFYAVCLSLACAVPVFNIICSNKQFNGNNNNSNNAVLISCKGKKRPFPWSATLQCDDGKRRTTATITIEYCNVCRILIANHWHCSFCICNALKTFTHV